MLELIFQGFIEWVYGLTLECWEFFSTVLLDIMSMDFSYLIIRMPVIIPIMEIMRAVGWALLIGNLVFQAVKTMLSGIGFEGEDPKLLFTRTFVFSFLLLASPQICGLCLNMTSTVIDLMGVPDAVNITFADEASFGGLAAAWLLVVICGVIVMFQSFKLIFEMAERYLILAVLTITAPLAFGMGGSRNTSDIFSGWCRMYGSMCLLMVMNVVFIKMLLSILSFYPSGLDVLPWMVLVFATVKVAKKIDGIITRIGLNPAITGDSLGRTFPGALTYLVLRSASAQIGKTINKSGGPSHGGRSPHTPPGGPGGPKAGGPFRGARTAGTGPSYSPYQSNSSQNHSAHSTTVQGDLSHNSTQEQTTGPAFSGSTQINHGGGAGMGTRRSSVPPSARFNPARMGTCDGSVVQSGGSDSGRGASYIRSSTVPSGSPESPMGLHGKSDAQPYQPKPGAAGKTASQFMHSGLAPARYTQVSRQTSQAGDIRSTVQMGEQNHTAVSTARPDSQAGSPAIGKPAPSAPGDGGTAIMRENRFTHRETVTSKENASPAQAGRAAGAAPMASTSPHPGSAGTAAADARKRQSVGAPHRSPAPTAPVPPAPPPASQVHSPAQQELGVRPHFTTAPARGTSPVMNPGTAETAKGAERASQGVHTARQSGERVKSPPSTSGQSGGGRIASSAIAMQKPHQIGQKTPPVRPRKGETNGRR